MSVLMYEDGVSFNQHRQCRKCFVLLRQEGVYVDEKAHSASKRKSDVGLLQMAGRKSPRLKEKWVRDGRQKSAKKEIK